MHAFDIERVGLPSKGEDDLPSSQHIDAGPEHVDEISPRIFGVRRRHGLDLSGENVVQDGSDQLVASAKTPVDRHHTHIRTPSDLLEGHLRPDLLERLDRDTNDPLVVTSRISPQGPPLRRHDCTVVRAAGPSAVHNLAITMQISERQLTVIGAAVLRSRRDEQSLPDQRQGRRGNRVWPGIGAATVVALAEAGADVVITSRTEEDLTKVAAPFMQETGGGAIANRATILSLASPAGTYITGEIIEVDDGSQLPPVDLWPSDL